MNTEICCKCNLIANQPIEPSFVQVDGFKKRIYFVNTNTNKVVCCPTGEISELKFKMFGIRALCLYESPDDCPFKFEHTMFDINERECYLKN